MPIFAPNWIFSRFTTWIFGGVRILLVGQCIYIYSGVSNKRRVWIKLVKDGKLFKNIFKLFVQPSQFSMSLIHRMD